MGDDEANLIRLWRVKRGEVEPEDLSGGNLIVQLGRVTEDLNRRWYERNTGHVIKDMQRRWWVNLQIMPLQSTKELWATTRLQRSAQTRVCRHLEDSQII
jgi:hypothetical protein